VHELVHASQRRRLLSRPMSKLEDLRTNAAVKGILPDALVTVVSTQWFGSEALELTYKTATGKVANELLYRHDEPRIDVVEQGRPWSFDGEGALFRLVSEAHRIRLAHLFDPLLAVHTSLVEPLPHQITAVYGSMLPRQPLRFLLADDPGAGKTIMAGLLIKELIARGDLQRCLVVCPGMLAEQWQDELYRRFNLPFDILTNDKLEAARTGNWFFETNLAIARLDKLSRNEDVQAKLAAPDCRWDLVVCDEAHKMSATFFGGEIKYTKRYRLGQMLSGLTRHFLLMSATPTQPHPLYVERRAAATLRDLAPTAAEFVIGDIPVTLPDESGRGFGGITWFLVAMIPLAVGAGLIRPALNSLMVQQGRPGESGAILGVSAAFVSLADAAAPLVGGWIFQTYGASAPFAVGGVVLGALLVISLLVLRPQRVATQNG